jgi:hypothetical protein
LEWRVAEPQSDDVYLRKLQKAEVSDRASFGRLAGEYRLSSHCQGAFLAFAGLQTL